MSEHKEKVSEGIIVTDGKTDFLQGIPCPINCDRKNQGSLQRIDRPDRVSVACIGCPNSKSSFYIDDVSSYKITLTISRKK